MISNNFLDILEDANAGADRYSSFEDGNMLEIEVGGLEKVELKSESGVKKTNNYYDISVSDTSLFHVGQKVVYKYIDKDGIEDKSYSRENRVVTVMSVGDETIRVISKTLLSLGSSCVIEMNYVKSESQKDNLNYPGDIFVSEVGYGSVKINFTPKEKDSDKYIIAYRKADERNDEWTYIETTTPYCTIEGVDREDYFVRISYVKGKEFSMMSDPVLLAFY